MKILVTGGNGLLGQKLTDLALVHEDIEWVSTSRGPNRHPVTSGYKYVALDLLDRKEVRKCLIKERPDCIIHTAAMTHVDACESNPGECRRLNVEVVSDLASFCEESGIHLIHLSTDFIFDGLAGPYREEDPPNPLSLYGRTKLESEEILREANCPWTIIRTILVYGVVADMSRSNIVLWAKSTLEQHSPIHVVNDQWRMPTLAEDLAGACLSAALSGVTGIFHVSGNDLFSIIELVREVADFWGLDKSLIRPISSETLDQKAARPAKTGFILDKAYAELKYDPTPFRAGLELMAKQLAGK